jgi:hypothetical protein
MLVTIAKRVAIRNGYRAMQASDLYVASGTTADWLYGTYRMAAFTIELSAVDYPKDTAIASETGRNRDALLYLLERAACPLAVLGTAVADARCGAFDDDLEVARGWSRDPDGTDTATTTARGAFGRGNPAGTSGAGVTLQPTATPSGRYAYVTGLPAGSANRSYDLDGRTTIRSPRITLPAAAGQRLTFRWFLAHGSDATAADGLRVLLETADGTRTQVWARAARAALVSGAWATASVPLDPWAGQPVRVVVQAVDAGRSSLVEAGIDDVRVTRPAP